MIFSREFPLLRSQHESFFEADIGRPIAWPFTRMASPNTLRFQTGTNMKCNKKVATDAERGLAPLARSRTSACHLRELLGRLLAGAADFQLEPHGARVHGRSPSPPGGCLSRLAGAWARHQSGQSNRRDEARNEPLHRKLLCCALARLVTLALAQNLALLD